MALVPRSALTVHNVFTTPLFPSPNKTSRFKISMNIRAADLNVLMQSKGDGHGETKRCLSVGTKGVVAKRRFSLLQLSAQGGEKKEEKKDQR